MLNRVDLSSRRNDVNDGMVLTDDGRAFQARVAAAGKARSPSVDRRVVLFYISIGCKSVHNRSMRISSF